MTTALLERAPGPAPPAPSAETYGHEQALDAMLYAVRRMGITATDRQVATLLTVYSFVLYRRLERRGE